MRAPLKDEWQQRPGQPIIQVSGVNVVALSTLPLQRNLSLQACRGEEKLQ
jgi:hypothetical protein